MKTLESRFETSDPQHPLSFPDSLRLYLCGKLLDYQPLLESALFSEPSGCTSIMFTVHLRPFRVLPFVSGVLLVQPSLVNAIIVTSI